MIPETVRMETAPSILILVANPAGTKRLALDAEARDIQMKLDATPGHRIQVNSRWAVTPDDLLHNLNVLKPTVVHFSGHGEGVPGLVFQDDKGRSSPVSGPALERLFSALRDNIRLVVLNACFSSEQGMAIAKVIDVVIGMDDEIGDDAARRFAAAFYRALGHGRSAKNAFDQGVAAIAVHGLGDEAVPRLLSKPGVDPDRVFLWETPQEHETLTAPGGGRQTPISLPDYPFSTFPQEFRDIVRPLRFPPANAVLNLVFGNLSRVRGLVPILPINQSFDFEQRGPRSVLAAFEKITVGALPLYTALEQLWPVRTRPPAAGLGSTQYLPLPANSMGMPGIIFAVTTRDLSRKAADYGYYVNTPLEGIDLVLESVIERALREAIPEFALPLLGAGYANVGRGVDKAILNAAVLGLTIIKVVGVLSEAQHPLRRIVVVAYSNDPQGLEEHAIWEFVVHLLAVDATERADWLRNWCATKGW